MDGQAGFELENKMHLQSNHKLKQLTFLTLFFILLSFLFLGEPTPTRANQDPAAANQLAFPLYYQGQGTSTDAEINHYLYGDKICPTTAEWEFTLSENGRLFGSYINLNPKAASGDDCVPVYDRDHPSRGENRIDFSGVHSEGHFEITESNLYYDYTNWKFRDPDINIQGYYDADHIYTSPTYHYESSTYSNWTDVIEHEFDLPLVSSGATAGGAEQDPVPADGAGQDAVPGDVAAAIDPWIPVTVIGAAGAAAAAVGVAGAGAAVAATSKGNKRGKKKQDENKKDPCATDLNRLKKASAEARALHDAIQTLRGYLAQLETQYENVRQAGYWSAAVDLGLLGASIFGAPLSVGLTGKAVVSQSIGRAMGESAAAALGGEMMKSVFNGMSGQGVSWENFVKAPYGGAEGVVAQNVITEVLAQRYATRLAQRGFSTSVRGPLLKGYTKRVASQLASRVMQLISVGKIVYGAYTEVQKLEAIREIMGKLRKSLFELELLYEEALSEMRISRSVYEKCRKLWQ